MLAVNGRCEVYMDGGVRHGIDIFKALALGAKAVFIGRPALFALACNVRNVLYSIKLGNQKIYSKNIFAICIYNIKYVVIN